MGSAAQPRSGTAPKEAATAAAPAFFRNLRRVGRFDKTTDCLALPVMSSSPDAVRPGRPPCCLWRHPSPAKNCLQYSFQFYDRDRREGRVRRGLHRAVRDEAAMAGKPLRRLKKAAKPREPAAPAREVAAAVVIARSI